MTTLSQAFAPGDLNFDLASAQNWQRGISTQRDSQDNRNNQQAIQDQIYGQQTNDKTKKKKNEREKGESKQQKQQVKYLCIFMRQNEWFDFDEKMSTKETEEQNKKEECALGTEI